MMKIKVMDRGKRYYFDGRVEPYKIECRQPLHNWLIAWLYHHVWERLTWRMWVKLERLVPKSKKGNECAYFRVPFHARQDLRCYHLTAKNRIPVEDPKDP